MWAGIGGWNLEIGLSIGGRWLSWGEAPTCLLSQSTFSLAAVKQGCFAAVLLPAKLKLVFWDQFWLRVDFCYRTPFSGTSVLFPKGEVEMVVENLPTARTLLSTVRSPSNLPARCRQPWQSLQGQPCNPCPVSGGGFPPRNWDKKPRPLPLEGVRTLPSPLVIPLAWARRVGKGRGKGMGCWDWLQNTFQGMILHPSHFPILFLSYPPGSLRGLVLLAETKGMMEKSKFVVMNSWHYALYESEGNIFKCTSINFAESTSTLSAMELFTSSKLFASDLQQWWWLGLTDRAMLPALTSVVNWYLS